MKKLISGISLMFFGIILFSIAHIQSSNLYMKLGTWNIQLGKYLTSIIESGGLLPFILGICLLALGLIYVLQGTYKK